MVVNITYHNIHERMHSGYTMKYLHIDLRQLPAAIRKKIQDVNVFINTTALGAFVIAK